jgi:hypothetical protein
MKVIIYTFFGKVLKEFPVPDNQTHHATFEEAREWALSNLDFNKWWIRVD